MEVMFFETCFSWRLKKLKVIFLPNFEQHVQLVCE
ncbi:unnamed protein product [Soboliphyme baturini]|uniref:Uncharacterized protein n=1 Tax=Soboliphyme baturini TaxID=241478 RepID=A0A183IQZ4_9BILA|nr:unnamed protein product [Soboliphyme baturini]